MLLAGGITGVELDEGIRKLSDGFVETQRVQLKDAQEIRTRREAREVEAQEAAYRAIFHHFTDQN